MTKIKDILSSTSHREYTYPDKSWTYYQEWNRAVFLHWEISLEILKELVPKELTIDTINGKAYISIVPFTMENIRPKYLPSIGFISNFHEINVRTYVVQNGKKGVYFLNIEAEKLISVLVSKHLSGLPYEKAKIIRNQNTFQSNNSAKNFNLTIDYSIESSIINKTELDSWLTERYCLYLKEKKQIFRYDIHHKEWPLNHIKINLLNLNYNIGNLELTNENYIAHYSKGIEVIAWDKVRI